jgi:hypothetical protein
MLCVSIANLNFEECKNTLQGRETAPGQLDKKTLETILDLVQQ